MRKNSQRTGIYDLENINSIELKMINPINENNEPLITAPTIIYMSNFIHFRDAVPILTIYKCGLRMSTLIQLEEK
ncbi:hypothetical protein [Lysinibacillus sp. NPDC092081]|uniref:hypothetical protein n=1 Tax=Lysinibacillus sp. NPDC092081 TaxID=3364131 RepID=UPI003830AF1F